MDLRLKGFKSISWLFFSGFFLFALLLGGAFHYAYQEGFYNTEKIAFISKADTKVKEYMVKLQEDRSLFDGKGIHYEALLSLASSLNQDLIIMEDFFTHDFSNLKNQNSSLLSELKVGKSATRLEDVFSIFHKKIGDFLTFVQVNNWRTLTRITQRIEARLNGRHALSSERTYFMVRSIAQDVELMRRVTQGSVLTDENKNDILARLDKINPEVELLTKGSTLERSITEKLLLWRKQVLDDLAQIAPELSLLQGEISTKGSFFFKGMIALSLASFLLGLMGFVFFRKKVQRFSSELERSFVNIIKGGVLTPSLQDGYLQNFSPWFAHELKKLNAYVQKRTGIGDVLSDSFPFPVLFINNNLKAEWCNQAFVEDWKISAADIEESSLTWDTISAMTNLNEVNPVQDAIISRVSGLFEIKVWPAQNEAARSYELYSIPVEMSGCTKAMLIFYPLEAFENAMDSMKISIVSPLKNAIQNVIDESPSQEFWSEEQLERFEEEGIHEIVAMLGELKNQYLSQKNDAELFIESLELKNQKEERKVAELQFLLQESKEQLKSLMKRLQNIGSSLEDFLSLEQIGKAKALEVHGKFSHVADSFNHLLTINNDYKQALHASQKSIPEINLFKEEVKKNLEEMKNIEKGMGAQFDELRPYRLLVADEKREEFDHRILEFSSEVKRMRSSLSILGDMMRKLDVILSKSQLQVQEQCKEQSTERQSVELAVLNSAEGIKLFSQKLGQELQEMSKEQKQSEEELLSLFQDLCTGVKVFNKKVFVESSENTLQ